MTADEARIDPNTEAPCGCDTCNPDVAETFPDLTPEQAVNSERYWAAVRAGALRRTGLNDPDREFNLARLRAEIEAQGVRRG